MRRGRHSGMVSGIALIAIGLLLFWLNRVEDLSDSILFFVIGSIFLGAYLYGKNYGLLIPGCILLGLGVGSVTRDWQLLDKPVLFGLGAGFLAIYGIALVYEKRSHWWPLIPGGFLLVYAFAIGDELMNFLFEGGWPLVLVLVGIVILASSWGRNHPHKGTD